MAGNVKVVLSTVFDDKGIKSALGEFGKIGKTVGIAMAAVGAAVAGAGIATVRFGADSIKAAEAVAQANNRLAQINKSMGLFGSQTSQVTDRLIKFAEASELNVAVDAEVIKATQAKLLTFKELGQTADEAGGAFDRATLAALDLAAAGFGSAETNAIQLGKALQDPIKGLTALRRAGVTFSEQEKQNIKVLVESGKTLQAQDAILKAIETQVGGTAAATATASDKMKLAFDNISESVGQALLPAFNEFSDELLKITPAISQALVPVADNLSQVFRQKVLPAIQDFTKWLASPEGTKKVSELTDSIIRGITELGKFTLKVIENWDAIKNAAIATAAFTAAFTAIRTALQLATAAQLLFNAAVKANPYVIAATALAGLVSLAVAGGVAMAGFAEDQKKARQASTGLTGRLAELVAEQKRLKELVDAGVISYGDYKKAIGPVNSELAALQGAMMRAAGAGQALNKVSIGSLRGQLSAAAGEANRFRNILAGIPAVVTGGGNNTGGGTVGPTLSQQRAEAAKQFNALVKETKAKLAEAKASYQKAVNEAGATLRKASKAANDAYIKAVDEATIRRNTALEQAAKDNAKTVESINKTYTARLADVVRQSIDRLRSAYASAVAVDVGRLFGEEEIGNSVDKLVNNLRTKLEASRRLLANTSALAAQGFSQTFIEQVVSAGTETGNELAQAILEATPETRGELKSLFNAIEAESETGMNALSKEIYDKAGLATTALKTLYADTQGELAAALTEQASLYAAQQAQIMTDFNEALAAASVARNAALQAARDAYVEDINAAFDAYKEDLKRIEKEYKDKLAGIENLSKELQRRGAALASQIDSAGKFIPKGIEPAKDIQNLPFIFPPSNEARPTNTININVKTDPTQTPALVGKQIATVVQRYTAVGGGAGGSAMPWQVM
jgi:DNA-directed RNA polymerase subunit F